MRIDSPPILQLLTKPVPTSLWMAKLEIETLRTEFSLNLPSSLHSHPFDLQLVPDSKAGEAVKIHLHPNSIETSTRAVGKFSRLVVIATLLTPQPTP